MIFIFRPQSCLRLSFFVGVKKMKCMKIYMTFFVSCGFCNASEQLLIKNQFPIIKEKLIKDQFLTTYLSVKKFQDQKLKLIDEEIKLCCVDIEKNKFKITPSKITRQYNIKIAEYKEEGVLSTPLYRDIIAEYQCNCNQLVLLTITRIELFMRFCLLMCQKRLLDNHASGEFCIIESQQVEELSIKIEKIPIFLSQVCEKIKEDLLNAKHPLADLRSISSLYKESYILMGWLASILCIPYFSGKLSEKIESFNDKYMRLAKLVEKCCVKIVCIKNKE